MFEELTIGRLKVSLKAALQRKNWPLAAILVAALVLVVLVVLLLEDSLTGVAKAGGGTMVDAFLAFTSWPLSPLLVALALFLVIVVAIGAILAREARPTTPECTQRHITDAEIQLADWAGTERNYDIENVNGRIKTQVTVDVNAIYSHTAPKILIHFDVLSSAMHRIVVGREIKGKAVYPPHSLGDTPKPQVDAKLENVTLILERGEEGRFTLVQPITVDLRDMWIRNRLGEVLTINLSGLGISVELLNPYGAGVVKKDNLHFDDNVKARLEKVADWPWHEEKWLKLADARADELNN